MDLHLLIFKVYDKLNEIGPDKYNEKLVYRDLQDAYDSIEMICDILDVDITTFSDYALERCVIKYATYYGYRNYTRLAERQLGDEPQTSQLHVMYDTIEVRRCLTMLFGVQFDENLIPLTITDDHKPILSGRGPSIADYNARVEGV